MNMKEYEVSNVPQMEIRDYIDQFIYYRKLRGYTQEQVGQVIGISGKQYYKYEKRMHQFKDKAAKAAQNGNKNDVFANTLGLLSYPVLMTADIMLYNATRIISIHF